MIINKCNAQKLTQSYQNFLTTKKIIAEYDDTINRK